jgi:septum formation topological specificity factor MinE
VEQKAQSELAKEEVVEVKEEESLEGKSGEELTQELLDSCLLELKNFFKSANKNMELAILDQQLKVQGGKVIIEVMGSVQEEIANKMRPDLVRLIRKYTGANKFSIQIELKEEMDTGPSKLYTNTEKFNFLKQKHPALMELQRKFGLEVDF